jgi:hypothetical protein
MAVVKLMVMYPCPHDIEAFEKLYRCYRCTPWLGFAVALVYLVILWQHRTQGEMGATSLICLER